APQGCVLLPGASGHAHRWPVIIAIAVLLLGGRVPAVYGQKTFLKAVPGAHSVDQAVAPDGSTYFILGLVDNPSSITLDGAVFRFSRGAETCLAKMGADGNWLWAKAVSGNVGVVQFTSVAAGQSFIVIGGSYIRKTGEQFGWNGANIAGVFFNINPNLKQGIILKLNLDGELSNPSADFKVLRTGRQVGATADFDTQIFGDSGSES